jgi:hypothetical protein
LKSGSIGAIAVIAMTASTPARIEESWFDRCWPYRHAIALLVSGPAPQHARATVPYAIAGAIGTDCAAALTEYVRRAPRCFSSTGLKIGPARPPERPPHRDQTPRRIRARRPARAPPAASQHPLLI